MLDHQTLMSKKTLLLALLTLLLSVLLIAQQPVERIDLNVIHKLKTAELGGGGGGFGGGGGGRGGGRGAVPIMETMYSLTDRYGPRLTNSPQFRAAGEWAVGQLKEWGLSNVHLEKWSTVPAPGDNGGGRAPRAAIPSWEMTEYEGAMVSPTYMPIIGYPQAWSGSTDGKVTGDAIMVANPTTMADMDKLHGTLKGKIVLLGTGPLDLEFPDKALGTRYTDAELLDMVPEQLPAGGAAGRGGRGGRGGLGGPALSQDEQRAVQGRLATFWKDEGALLTISANGTTRGSSGVVPASNGSSRNGDPTKNIASIAVTAENYNRVARLLEHGFPVKLSFNIQTKFDMSQTDSFNVIAEIPGASKPNELVMVGGHFDSWHMGTGATDNGAGSAVAMEVMRILKSSNLKMDRTVRMALWGGEEEGLLGSAAYVKEHFADPATMKTTAEHDGFAGYFNIDNGTGRVRGIYLQGDEMVRPIFEQWFAAIKDLTPGVITIRNTGGTDHQSFDAVGLPGFQFIQDPMDYESRTHHTNMDTYERIQQADMEQMAIVEAFFVYQAATRPDKLPRKDLPAARGNGGRGRGGN
jgi:carboxypeptidase Q